MHPCTQTLHHHCLTVSCTHALPHAPMHTAPALAFRCLPCSVGSLLHPSNQGAHSRHSRLSRRRHSTHSMHSALPPLPPSPCGTSPVQQRPLALQGATCGVVMARLQVQGRAARGSGKSPLSSAPWKWRTGESNSKYLPSPSPPPTPPPHATQKHSPQNAARSLFNPCSLCSVQGGAIVGSGRWRALGWGWSTWEILPCMGQEGLSWAVVLHCVAQPLLCHMGLRQQAV